MQGFLLLDKPEGITSFGAVARIKRMAGEKRVGHTGTLDPMATGVLPIFIGRATALSAYLLDADKSYRATIRLGIKTDTCDITGEITAEKTVLVTNEQLDEVLKGFMGEQRQTPPMFSAIKQNGVRLYELARQGKEVEIPSRRIAIHSLDRLSGINSDNEFSIDTLVSKGTYIRSLCRDIGDKLGCGATLSALRRTSASGFDISRAVSLDKLTADNISDYILNEDEAVAYMPEINVTEKQAVRFSNGGQLDFDRLKKTNFNNGDIFRVKYNGILLGLGRADCEKNQLAIACVINSVK